MKRGASEGYFKCVLIHAVVQRFSPRELYSIAISTSAFERPKPVDALLYYTDRNSELIEVFTIVRVVHQCTLRMP